MTRIEPFAYRRDDAVPAFDDALPVIIFDGKCVLCSGFVQAVMKADRRKRLRLLAAQTPLGEALYRHFDLRYGDFETYVLLEAGRVHVKSDAALRIFAILALPWSLITIGYILALLIFLRILASCSTCVASRFKISSKIPPASPARTMFM